MFNKEPFPLVSMRNVVFRLRTTSASPQDSARSTGSPLRRKILVSMKCGDLATAVRNRFHVWRASLTGRFRRRPWCGQGAQRCRSSGVRPIPTFPSDDQFLVSTASSFAGIGLTSIDLGAEWALHFASRMLRPDRVLLHSFPASTICKVEVLPGPQAHSRTDAALTKQVAD